MKKYIALLASAIVAVLLFAVPAYATPTTLTVAQLLAKQICTSNCSYTGTTTLQTYLGVGIPTLATSTGSGLIAGTSTLAASSTDLAGRITVVSGQGSATSSTIFTFTSASSTAQFCIVMPVGTTTTALYAATGTIPTFNQTLASTTIFTLITGPTTGLTATTTYSWNYLCN